MAEIIQSETLQDQLARICSAISFANSGGPVVCQFNHEPVVQAEIDAYSLPHELTTEQPMTLALRNRLYQQCYANTFNERAEYQQYTFSSTQLDSQQEYKLNENLTPLLSSANRGQTSWDSGWTVESITPEGMFYVSKQDLRRYIWAGEFLKDNGIGQPTVEGSAVSLYRPSESTQWQDGFYFAFSKAATDHFDQQELVRFYWNIEADGSAALVSAITTEFNRYQIPFRFKCNNRRSLSQRVDAAVLYVPVEHFRLTLSLVLGIQHEARKCLRTAVPLFTKRVAKGLSFAQNPRGGSSFGMERCLRLARAILQSDLKNSERPDIETVIQRLMSEGLDFNKPHLTPGFPDLFTPHLQELCNEHAS